jgi:hypothetical protein
MSFFYESDKPIEECAILGRYFLLLRKQEIASFQNEEMLHTVMHVTINTTKP